MPYTYSITHLPTGLHYYGARFTHTATPEDLGTTYFSSSKSLKRLIKEEGVDKFKFKVRRMFSSREEAAIWEHRFLTRVGAKQSPRWFNLTNGWLGAPFDSAGIRKTTITRQRMSKPKLPEHRSKLSAHLDKVRTIPPQTEEVLRTKSRRMMGNKNGVGHSRIMSEEEKYQKRLRAIGNQHNKGKTFTRQTYVCPLCNFQGKGGGMKRYHFDNCKEKRGAEAPHSWS